MPDGLRPRLDESAETRRYADIPAKYGGLCLRIRPDLEVIWALPTFNISITHSTRVIASRLIGQFQYFGVEARSVVKQGLTRLGWGTMIECQFPMKCPLGNY